MKSLFNKLIEEVDFGVDIDDIISKLRDGNFTNINSRIEFLKLILPLAVSTDPKARKVVRAMGDLMTSLGSELLTTTKEYDIAEKEVKEDENEMGRESFESGDFIDISKEEKEIYENVKSRSKIDLSKYKKELGFK